MGQLLADRAGAVRVGRRLQRLEILADLERGTGHRRDKGLEGLVAGHEVGLGVHLDHRRLSGGGGDADQPLGRDPAGFLGRRGEPLVAQPVHRLLDVAAGLGQRLLAVHHARAGLLAQVLHQCSRDLGHRIVSLIRRKVGAGPRSRPGLARGIRRGAGQAAGCSGAGGSIGASGIASIGRSSEAPMSRPDAPSSALMPSSTAPATRSQ